LDGDSTFLSIQLRTLISGKITGHSTERSQRISCKKDRNQICGAA
jgi:hypothetical protein